jgi:capsular exopolysaccharide synthesis family protein
MSKKDKNSILEASSYSKISTRLLTDETPFAARESYKSARTHLLYIAPGDGCKKIAFTSALEHEGKSLTCINLAISMAQTGKRVLIIDADLRRPMMKNVFELQETQGLSEQLAGLSGIGNIGQLFAVKTKCENLAVLPSGRIPPNPAELLSSPKLHKIFEVLEQHFDYIFIDTPPIGAVTDTALLIPEVQGHIFVVRAGDTRIDNLKKAVFTMNQLGANILGFILNDYDPKKSHHAYGYDRYGKYNSKYSHYFQYGYGHHRKPDVSYGEYAFKTNEGERLSYSGYENK